MISAENEAEVRSTSQKLQQNENSLPFPLISSSNEMYFDDVLIKDDTAEASEGSSLSLGMLIGIGVGGVVVIIIIVYVCCKCSKNKVVDLEEQQPEKLPDYSHIQGQNMTTQNQSSFLKTTEDANLNNIETIYL